MIESFRGKECVKSFERGVRNTDSSGQGEEIWVLLRGAFDKSFIGRGTCDLEGAGHRGFFKAGMRMQIMGVGSVGNFHWRGM